MFYSVNKCINRKCRLWTLNLILTVQSIYENLIFAIFLESAIVSAMEFTESNWNIVNLEQNVCIIMKVIRWLKSQLISSLMLEKKLRLNVNWCVRKSRFIIVRIHVIAVSVALLPKIMYSLHVSHSNYSNTTKDRR